MVWSLRQKTATALKLELNGLGFEEIFVLLLLVYLPGNGLRRMKRLLLLRLR
jgi:hypothetical protein